jgi:hypothetical protein
LHLLQQTAAILESGGAITIQTATRHATTIRAEKGNSLRLRQLLNAEWCRLLFCGRRHVAGFTWDTGNILAVARIRKGSQNNYALKRHVPMSIISHVYR